MPARIGSRSTFVREGWIVFPIILVLGLLAIAAQIAADYDSMAETLRDAPWILPAVLVFVAGTAMTIEGVRDLRTGARMRHVARLRPDATVRPVQSFNSMLEMARRLRASGAGVGYSEWSCQVIAILPDRVEYWATSGDEPRWFVRRAHMDVSLAQVRVDLRRLDLLRITDAASPTKIEVRPVGRPIWTSYRAKYRQEAMELLIRDLGQDPSHVLVER